VAVQRSGNYRMSGPKILVAGEIYIDLLMTGIDAWPQPGKEIFATAFRREIGGGAAITASALARLGCPCGVLAAVGNDYGTWVCERLNACGVATDNIHQDGDATGFTVIASRPEDRAFITYVGANRSFTNILQSWIDNNVNFPKHVHFSVPLSLGDAPDFISALQQRGVSVSVDVGWNQNWLSDERAWDVATRADIFFPNAVEAMHITGEEQASKMLEKFASRGAQHVALKLGSQGAAMLWDDQIQFVDPIPVGCVDTTGAGDCFNAGFLQPWLSGASPLECLRAANVCGALSTEGHGGIEGAPSLERLHAELRKLKT
jgi:sugar/nucleoside kinase (ribokinase family)